MPQDVNGKIPNLPLHFFFLSTKNDSLSLLSNIPFKSKFEGDNIDVLMNVKDYA